MYVGLDLGGGYVKVGLGEKRLQVPNCTATLKKSNSILIADQTAVECVSFLSLSIIYAHMCIFIFFKFLENDYEVS